MTKSKSSTIAIVVLSVLLAAALASTIVLAAFTQTRTATTTIQFANGIILNLSSTTNSDFTMTNDTNGTGFTITPVSSENNTSVTIPAVTWAEGNTTAKSIFVTYRIYAQINNSPAYASDGLLEFDPKTGAEGVYETTSGDVKFTLTAPAVNGTSGSVTIFKSASAAATSGTLFTSLVISGVNGDNDLAGKTVKLTFSIGAGETASDAWDASAHDD